MSDKILLVDGYSLIHRGFYALPLLTDKDGQFTNAVYGFLNILFKLFDEEAPSHVIVAFDTPTPTFRHVQYDAYKGGRKPMPEELRPQIPLLKQVLQTMQIATIECPGFEADDILGTLATKAAACGLQPVIISGDRDLLQVATDRIQIRIPKTKGGKTEVENYFAADVEAALGVTPKAYIDVKALMGDASDNIPGVPGIGTVTATKIIAAYGSVENAIAHAADIKPKKASENLTLHSEQALLSKTLATIILDAPVSLDTETAAIKDIWNADALALFTRLGFKTYLPRFGKATQATGQTTVKTKIVEAETDAAAFFVQWSGEQIGLFDTPADAKPVAFCVLAEQKLLGMAFACEPEHAVYMRVCDTLTESALVSLARPFLASAVPKLALDVKSETQLLRRFGIEPQAVVFDAMLAGYVLNASKPNINESDLALDYLGDGAAMPMVEDLLDNKGKKAKDRLTLADLPVETVAAYAGRKAEVLFRAYPVMRDRLVESGQWDLYAKIELPLATVLADMEQVGITVNRDALMDYGQVLDTQINRLADEIHALAGEPFNIQSPAQLGVVLFEKLGLPHDKKTTQGYSTAAAVLEKLKHRHPIVPKITEYRMYAKLKSTYADGLLAVTDPATSKIYSTFHQALTTTGRISSAEPNLQNIPIRMPLGRQLRKVFVPSDDAHIFIDADYSQIELRVLAHVSGDETLIRAFHEGQDIHRLTASQVFHVPLEAVTAEQRSNAKAVNFGIVYGISAFGLSEDLGINIKEAERYIAGYFEKYPRVKAYLDEVVARAKAEGYAETIYRRRRAIPEIQSKNFVQRGFGERVAMNMPIQGSAADIIKIAMINVARRLAKERLNARLILQVHDELLLEVAKPEKETVKALLRAEMEQAADLAVPLEVDLHEGETWYDTK